MKRNDWDVMILHYLGLDHIGHLAGPTSPLVQPKLREMDDIIKMIYNTAVTQDQQRNISTLIVLCGDHGMSDGGSHGGSSFPETTTPLVFMSSLFQHGRGRFYSSQSGPPKVTAGSAPRKGSEPLNDPYLLHFTP